MLPPSLAIAWTLWRRHRWSLVLILAYLGAAGALSAVLPTAKLAPWAVNGIFGAVTMPMAWVAICLIGFFCFGFDADLNARESCFPASMFPLPVSTGELAGWPLAYGTAAAGLVWVFFACFILRPWLGAWGLMVPLWWPAMCAAAGLAWMQALLWLPFGLPSIRILLMTAVGYGFASGVSHSVNSTAAEGELLAIFTGLAAVAWAGAYVGVRRARRGEVPNWQGLLQPFCRLAACLPRSRQPFTSAARAHVWLEWRRTGMSLPFMTGLVLPVALSPLALLGKNDVIPTENTLLGALAIPVVLGGIAGIRASRDRSSKEHHGLAPFTATLPMSTADMIGAKLKEAALSVLATWILLAAVVPLAIVLTGTLDEVAGWWQQALRTHQPIEVIAALVAVAVLLVLWTWKRQVDSSLLEMTGRPWVLGVTVCATMGGMVALGIGGSWIYHHPATHETLLAALPYLLGLLLLVKLLMTCLAVRQALRRRLLATRTVAIWIACEFFVVVGLFGLLAWSVPAEPLAWYYLACGIFWWMPMARLAATPLALAWNRHR